MAKGEKKQNIYLTYVFIGALVTFTLCNTFVSCLLVSILVNSKNVLQSDGGNLYVTGNAYFNRIHTFLEHLNIFSQSSINLSSNGTIMHLGRNVFAIRSDSLRYENNHGPVAHFKKDSISLPLKNLRSSKRSVTVDNSIMTNFVRSGAGTDLSLIGSSGLLSLMGPQAINFDSFGGNVNINSHRDARIKSKEIYLQGRKISLPNLKMTYSFSGMKHHYNGSVYQLCACEEGQIFIAKPDADCTADYHVCNVKM